MRVVRSNEKSCVCNVFATPQSKNPVKSSVPSYQNVNHTFSERTISKRIFDSSGLRFWGVFVCVLLEDNGLIYIDLYYDLQKEGKESPLEFAIRNGWNYICIRCFALII